MRDKIYQVLRGMDTTKIINNANTGIKYGIEITIKRYGAYRMRCPDNPCITCIVQASCHIKKLYDLADFNIIKTASFEPCEKIDLWNEIVKCEEIKEKFLAESGKRKFKGEIKDDLNYKTYLALCIHNYEKSERFEKL